MSDIAEKNAQKTLAFMKRVSDLLAELLQSFMDYQQSKRKFSPQKELADWLRNKGETIFLPIQGKCHAELLYELNKQKIAYIDFPDENKVVIKAPDFEAVRKINREILVAKCNYFQEVDSREMENAIAKMDRIKNKNIFTLRDMNKYQVEVLKHKCNKISAGFMVGIVKNENLNFDLSVHGDKILSDNPKRVDFCKAYLQMAFSLYGPNSEIKMKQIDADEKIDMQIENLKGSGEVRYVVGVDDTNRFIEINENGFEYYETALDEHGIRSDKQMVRCDVNDVNYDSELERCLDRIYNKTIINNTEDLARHLSTNDRVLETDRPAKSYDQYHASLAEDSMADQIDSMIKKNISVNKKDFPDEQAIFSFYQHEAAEIISAASQNKPLLGYLDEDVKKIAEICAENNIDIQRYKGIPKVLTFNKGEIHTAQRIKYVEKEVPAYGNTDR